MPAEVVYVFDACAVIALLKAEPGAAVVETLLQEEGNRCIVHAISAAGTLVTSDHHELDRIAEAQTCPIRFIR